MVTHELINVSFPKASEFGIFQIEGMTETYFRFELQAGQPILDHDLFVASEQNKENQQRPMSSSMYHDLQDELSRLVAGLKDNQK